MMELVLALMMALVTGIDVRALEFQGVESDDNSVYACEGQTLNLSCSGQAGFIRIIRANYGRFSVAICNEEGRTDLAVNCFAENSLQVLRDKCDNKSWCEVSATFDEFRNEPCQGTRKYLEAHFYCHNGTFLEASSSTSTSTTRSTLPPWMTTTATPSTASSSTESFTTSPSSSTTRRIPITFAPSVTDGVVTTSEWSRVDLKGHSSTKKVVKDGFLGSSIASTNIMDTSEMPVEVTNSAEETTQRRQDESRDTSEAVTVDQVEVVIASPTSTVASMSTALLGNCQPLTFRQVDWSWTKPDSPAVMPCPAGSFGLARWYCKWDSDPRGPWPDLSECRSDDLLKVSKKIMLKEERLPMLQVANELLRRVSDDKVALFGGDLHLLVSVMEVINLKIVGTLRSIPTVIQREAVVVELVQTLVKILSRLVEPFRLQEDAWRDLVWDERRWTVLDSLISAVQASASLLPVVKADPDVTITSDNVVLCVQRWDWHLPGGGTNGRRSLIFPTHSALASKSWSHNGHSLQIDTLVASTTTAAAEPQSAIFMQLKNVDLISRGTTEDKGSLTLEKPRVASHLLTVTSPGHLQGRQESLEITITFPKWHNSSNSRNHCVRRIDGDWSSSGCRRLSSNATHITCQCDTFSGYLLMSTDNVSHGHHGVAKTLGTKTTNVTSWFSIAMIFVVIVSSTTVIVLVLLGVVCYRRYTSPDYGKSGVPLWDCCCQRQCGDENATADICFEGRIVTAEEQSPTFRPGLHHHGERHGLHLQLQPLPITPDYEYQSNHSLISPIAEMRETVGQVPDAGRCRKGRWLPPFGTARPILTPERPLLTDFPSPGQSSPRLTLVQQVHDYDEIILDPWRRGAFQQQQLPLPRQYHQPGPRRGQYQHQLWPEAVADSSNSSQSSGYISSSMSRVPRQSRTPATTARRSTATMGLEASARSDLDEERPIFHFNTRLRSSQATNPSCNSQQNASDQSALI